MLMKIMAIDYGEKFIGIAVNEPVFMTVHGRDTLLRRDLSSDMAYILELATKEDVDMILVGLPLSEDGTETKTSEKVRSFVKNLKKKMLYSSKSYKNVDIVFWNERFTTRDADLLLEEDAVPRRKRKRYLDKLSAMLLLEDYISECLCGKSKKEEC